jgi:hypothetical protein
MGEEKLTDFIEFAAMRCPQERLIFVYRKSLMVTGSHYAKDNRGRADKMSREMDVMIILIFCNLIVETLGWVR